MSNPEFPVLVAPSRFRTIRLEDGEPVIPLRGRRPKPRHPSDAPHAGLWAPGLGYVLVPFSLGKRTPLRATLGVYFETLGVPAVDRSSDSEILFLAPLEAIFSLLKSGPPSCRARIRHSPRSAAHLTAHRFKSR